MSTAELRAGRGEQGFTLVELMVVILIIAILLAIAIPSFLAARNRGQDRATQTAVNSAVKAEAVYYSDQAVFTDVPASLKAVESSLTWVNVPSTGPNEIYVRMDPANDQVVCLEALSASGTTWVIARIAAGPNGGTYFGTASMPACSEAAAAALPTSW